jgi:hypothetical protein
MLIDISYKDLSRWTGDLAVMSRIGATEERKAQTIARTTTVIMRVQGTGKRIGNTSSNCRGMDISCINSPASSWMVVCSGV